MANLINSSFFIRDLNLVNIDQTAVSQRITSFIDKYEKECLIELLGYELYKAAVTANWAAPFDAIKNGSDYTVNGKLNNWKGLVYDTTNSLIANYIYFMFQQNDAQKTAGVNTQVPKGQNAVVVSPADKMCTAWSFFSEESFNLISFLWNKRDTYTQFDNVQYCKAKSFSRPINILGI